MRQMMKKILLLFFILLAVSLSLAYAEIFYLKDGTIVEGTIASVDERNIKLRNATISEKNPNEPGQEYSLLAATYYINKHSIERIEKSKAPSFQAGSTEETRGSEKDTITFFENIKNEEPNNPYSWEALGIAYADQKNFNKAIECFKKAIEMDQGQAMPHTRLAVIYKILGMKEKARNEYKNALSLINEELRRNQAKLDTLRGAEKASFEKWTIRMNESVKKSCEENLKALE